jgi:hypothetical protein
MAEWKGEDPDTDEGITQLKARQGSLRLIRFNNFDKKKEAFRVNTSPLPGIFPAGGVRLVGSRALRKTIVALASIYGSGSSVQEKPVGVSWGEIGSESQPLSRGSAGREREKP